MPSGMVTSEDLDCLRTPECSGRLRQRDEPEPRTL